MTDQAVFASKDEKNNKNLSEIYGSNKKVNTVAINCDEENGKKLAARHGVQGYPTFMYHPSGLFGNDKPMNYDGPRTSDAWGEYIRGQN